MSEYGIQYKKRLSKQQARSKICAHAMFGNHGISPRPKSPSEVQNFFLQKGINTDIMIEECRDPKHIVSHFENLVRSTWIADMTSGGSVSLVNGDGEVISEMKKPGLFIWSNYQAHFEAACSSRDRAVQTSSYSDFQECLTQGFASMEAFFNEWAMKWNKQFPENPLVDALDHKVSLEEKMEKWIPMMSGGGQVEKSNQVWNDFKSLKKLRDDNAIHPKLPGQTIVWDVFASQINAFRLGIAQLLANLHRHTGLDVPSVIINAIYMPDVEVVTEQQPT